MASANDNNRPRRGGRGGNNVGFSSSFSKRSTTTTNGTKRGGHFPLLRMNVSISSISEDEAVTCFDDSALSDMSSLTFLTCSSSSLQFNLGPVTQGPGVFEEGTSKGAGAADKAKNSCMAPKMPRRINDSSSNLMSTHALQNVKDDDDNDNDNDDNSNGSLTLDDILEESNHSSSTTTTTATVKTRQWNESGPKHTGAVQMPVRTDSLHHNSGCSWGLDSSSTSVLLTDDEDLGEEEEEEEDDEEEEGDEEETISYASSSTIGSFAGGDSFSQLNLSVRCAI